MKTWNKKKKPKHWVISHWKKTNIDLLGYIISLKSKYKPKESPYPKRRMINFFNENQILSWSPHRKGVEYD